MRMRWKRRKANVNLTILGSDCNNFFRTGPNSLPVEGTDNNAVASVAL